MTDRQWKQTLKALMFMGATLIVVAGYLAAQKLGIDIEPGDLPSPSDLIPPTTGATP